jgi:hypothetical protein
MTSSGSSRSFDYSLGAEGDSQHGSDDSDDTGDGSDLPRVAEEEESSDASSHESDEYADGKGESGLLSPTRGEAIRLAVERGEIYSPLRDRFATPTKNARNSVPELRSPQSIASPSATPGDCPICLFPLADPETLHCSHTYCASCIDSLRHRMHKKKSKRRRSRHSSSAHLDVGKEEETDCPLCSRTSSSLFIQQRWHCRAVAAVAQETARANENETTQLRSGTCVATFKTSELIFTSRFPHVCILRY